MNLIITNCLVERVNGSFVLLKQSNTTLVLSLCYLNNCVSLPTVSLMFSLFSSNLEQTCVTTNVSNTPYLPGGV